MNITKIVAITQPLIDGVDSAEEFIAYAARVSNPGNQMNNETSANLLKYCIRNKHFSVFEMVNVVMQIDTTRDIGRQILRHRSFSFQEFSQRYANPTGDLGFSHREVRLQDKKNRQNSIETDDADLAAAWEEKQAALITQAADIYDWAIVNHIAKEQARVVLPEGLTNSRLYMSGSLRSWIHYVELRTEAGTQKEHREVANNAKHELLTHFAFLNNLWNNQ